MSRFVKTRSILTAALLIMVSLNCAAQKAKDEPTSFRDDLTIEWNTSEDTLRLIAKNKLLTPLGVYFTSKETNEEVKSFLLPPKDSIVLVKYHGQLTDSIFTKDFNDSIKVGYFFGHESVIKPDLDYLYRLPFKKRKKYEVTQSFNGKSSHSSISSQYAIDFQLNIGEAVHAAREGRVVKVIDWFTKQGGKELTRATNKIVILHDDGTLASYAHLDYQGAFVKEGDFVERGQKIGVSGLTGFTRGPHLHFVVRKEKDIAIPIYFKGYEGMILKSRKRYKVVD